MTSEEPQGFYILFDDFRANYVGLARGVQGIGSRLQARRHASQLEPLLLVRLRRLRRRTPVRLEPRSAARRSEGISSERVLAECEALLITVLGSRDQNQMRFHQAKCWEQLRESDFLPGGVGRKVETEGYTDAWLRGLARSRG